jgi:outer membrane biosynthesis protein TonB
MGRVWLIATIMAMPAGFAGGQQSGSPKPSEPKNAQVAPVKVYAPSSKVKEPKLLPIDPLPTIAKDCKKHTEGEVLLSLLVDTTGAARNVMFLRPAGSAADRFAVHIASQDRFEPGTLNGTPVVVAEALRIKLETCESTVPERDIGIELKSVLGSMPRQKLEKPKDPPEEAILAPRDDGGSNPARIVRRPDFFGNGVTAPVLLYSQDAEYLQAKTGMKITGECELGVVVDRHGLPQGIHVIKTLDPGLDLSAVLAVDKYRFFPAIRDGEEPVPAAIVVSVKFAPPK